MSTGASGLDLEGLFAPTSVAVIGASQRPGRPGLLVLRSLRRLAPDLRVVPVTPTYSTIDGLTCVGALEEAGAVDLAIVASGVDRAEADVERALAAGVRGLVVFGAPDPGPERDAWVERLGRRAGEAGVPLLGPDTLGFTNVAAGVGATWATPGSRPGGVAVVSQSGTTYWEANTCDPRLGFSLSVHGGLEAQLTLADLVRYCVTIPETRVVGVYVETVRDPEGLVDALEVAAARAVPVVALYAGRSERARSQMTTHAGRLAGDRAALEGLFRHHGVVRATSTDDWWTTLALLGGTGGLGEGGVAAVMDSGGGLALFHDSAEEMGVPVARLRPTTTAAIEREVGIADVTSGAVDFWIGQSDRHGNAGRLLRHLADDPDAAAVLAFTTYAEDPDADFATHVADAVLEARRDVATPVVAATYTARQLHPALMLRLADEGVPILDGLRGALGAVRHALDVRDARARPWAPALAVDEGLRARLGGADLLEADALELLGSIGVPVVETARVTSREQAVAAARRVGLPVVVKTDEEIAHKASRGGVRVELADESAVAEAYDDVAARLGPRAVVAPMRRGHELAVGVVATEFGPLVMVSAGGIGVESVVERVNLLAPLREGEVAAALEELALWRLLGSTVPEASRAAFIELVERVGAFAHALADHVRELDLNPVLVGAGGCVAIDALIGVVGGE